MGEGTAIEWAANADGSPGMTWNPIAGCSVHSPGCTNCYAMVQAGGARLARTAKYQGLTVATKAGPVWNGELRIWEPVLDEPLRKQKPRVIFVNSMSDLFHEAVPLEWQDRVFDVMEAAARHTFIVLTKRADVMRAYLTRRWAGRIPPANIWIGVSVEDQVRADQRLPDLALTPAAIRLVSCEPLLGAIDLKGWIEILDWVIAGGESGKHARLVHPEWIRSLRDQCARSAVAFFFKQWGEYHPSADHDWRETGCEATPEALHVNGKREFRPTEILGLIRHDGPAGWAGLCRVGKKRAGWLLDGREHSARPPIHLPEGLAA